MIERIYVHNYRCLVNFTLDLTGRKSALVIGKNGSGKSTLRDALCVIKNICQGPFFARQWIDSSDFPQNHTDIPMRFEVTLKLNKKQFDYRITFEYSQNSHEALVFDEKLAVDGNAIFTRLRDQIGFSAGTTISLDTRMSALRIINEKPGDGTVMQLRSFLGSMILLSPVPAQMSGFTDEESFDIQVNASNFAAWLSAVLSRNPARYNDILKYLQFVIPDIASFEFVPRGERGKQLFVNFDINDRGNGAVLQLEFRKLSDGEKCFFLSALIVAVNRPESPVFCLWDEPDNYLSLPEISHFVTGLRRLGNQNGQFIAMSHNPEVIRRFSDENTLVLTRNSHLDPAVIRPLAEVSYTGDIIEALLRNEVMG